MSKIIKNKYFIFFLIFLIIMLIVKAVLVGRQEQRDKEDEASIKVVDYREFLELAKAGKVDYIDYKGTDEYMTFSLYNEETEGKTRDELEKMEYTYPKKDLRRTIYPAYDEFRKDMLGMGISLKANVKRTMLINAITSIITVLIPFIIIVLLFNMLSGIFGGIDKKELVQTSDKKFSDIIGHDEILEDIKFITDMIQNPKKSEKAGVTVPKGILLSGDSGTGKTLIAKAIAGEAGVPFLYMNASSFVEMYVGVGAKRVRGLFKVAKENAPCVVFIDEIDAVGGSRDGRGSIMEHDQTLNALLQEMDGFIERKGIFVIAATNRPDRLDKALLRSGRFDRQIVVGKPKNWHVRKDLFEFYLKDMKLAEDIDLESISKQTVDFTGADIQSICNEAGIIALMQNKKCIDTACIEESIDKKIFKGNRSNKDEFLNDKKIVAYHESGHAVVTYLLNMPIARATIVGTTSGVGGFVMQTESESYFTTDEELRHQIMIAYGGRASEQIKFDDKVTTGSSSDITQATNIMLAYIEKYGFDRSFGYLDMSVLTAQQLITGDSVVNRLADMSKKLYSDTFVLLSNNYNLVEVLAEKLLEEETLSGDAIKALLDGEKSGERVEQA